MNNPLVETVPGVKYVRADLVNRYVQLLEQHILELKDSPDSLMDIDHIPNVKFVPDTNSPHGIFADADGKSMKTVRIIAQLGHNQMLNPYFTMTARDKSVSTITTFPSSTNSFPSRSDT